MLDEPPLSRWAVNTFGERASTVRRIVAESIMEAIESARDAQEASRTKWQHPFGLTFMSRKFETLSHSFRDMPDVITFRPSGSLHELTVVSGNLLLPFEFAKDRSINIMRAQIGGSNKISDLLKMLFARFGPEPTAVQLALEVIDKEESRRQEAIADSLARLPEDTKLVLIAVACNSQAGLIGLWWGEAELLDEYGRLKWAYCEEIPLPKSPPTRGQAPILEISSGDVPPPPKFDAGPMPTPTLSPRPAIEVKNEKVFPPRSEVEEPTQDVADDEGP